MNTFLIVIIAILIYNYLIPIIECLSALLQSILVTWKMKVNIKYSKYEKEIENIQNNVITPVPKSNAIGFIMEDEGEYYEEN